MMLEEQDKTQMTAHMHQGARPSQDELELLSTEVQANHSITSRHKLTEPLIRHILYSHLVHTHSLQLSTYGDDSHQWQIAHTQLPLVEMQNIGAAALV